MDIKGFQFSAVEAAIKKPGRKDLALIFSEVPARACAVFTVNSVKNGSHQALHRHCSSTAATPTPAPVNKA
jgi:N-acetylglutamate synthase/N-acetylornithine aminotransferase